MPINPDHIHEELESIHKIITKWKNSVSKGIVGVDLPGANAEEKYEKFLREFTGELLFVSGKCQNMAVVLSER
jgi:hypothetical protein